MKISLYAGRAAFSGCFEINSLMGLGRNPSKTKKRLLKVYLTRVWLRANYSSLLALLRMLCLSLEISETYVYSQ